MTKLRELKLIRDSIDLQINNVIEELREIASSRLPEHDEFISCIHLDDDGVYSCSVWSRNKKCTDKDFYSDVEYNDIKHGSKVVLEQDKYCQSIQLILCKLNEIEGYKKCLS